MLKWLYVICDTIQLHLTNSYLCDCTIQYEIISPVIGIVLVVYDNVLYLWYAHDDACSLQGKFPHGTDYVPTHVHVYQYYFIECKLQYTDLNPKNRLDTRGAQYTSLLQLTSNSSLAPSLNHYLAVKPNMCLSYKRHLIPMMEWQSRMFDRSFIIHLIDNW